MIRHAARAALTLLLFAAVLDSAGRGQGGGNPDKIYFRDKKDHQVRSIEGELKMSPAGIQVMAGGKVA